MRRADPNHHLPKRGGTRHFRHTLLALCALLLALGVPATANAGSIEDAGEGFPLSLNLSDHVLIGRLVEREEEGKSEEDLEGPWSIWAGGKSTPLEPLNGGPETPPDQPFGSIEHQLVLYRLNAAGDAGGTSTISYFDGEGEEHTTRRGVWYSPTGVGHEVPPLVEETFDEEGHSHRPGAIGTGIDEAGDVAGLGVVQDGENLLSRGFFSAGGTAHPSIVGESDGPWTEVLEMNEAGEMLGIVAELNEEAEPIHSKYVLWSGPSARASVLDFDEPLAGFGLANDGSLLGYRAGTLYLRAPGGNETEVAGLSKPFAVNASHEVVGSEAVKGLEHAAVWQDGEVTDLNTLLPIGSGWVLTRALAINDKGDIAGIGTHLGKQRAFLFKPEVTLEASISGKPSVALPEEGTAVESFTVTLSEASTETVTVGYETEDGTATVENDDYSEASGTLTFKPGETDKTIEVQIDDGNGNDDEASEAYTVRLQGSATVTPAASATTATGTIGLPGIAGKLSTGPASGAAKPLSPAAGISIEVLGKTTAGQAVKQTVTSDAAGAYTASVDAGTYSLTATGVPAGQPTGFKWSPSAKCPGKRKDATCEAVTVKSANGEVVQSTVDFGYGQRDPQVENIEVLQATQLKTWDTKGPEIGVPGVGKVASYSYSGVGLAAKSPTIVRVYASNNGPGSAQAVSVQLKGYEVGSGGLTALPGGALTALDGSLDALPEPVVETEHQDAGATFNFQLPESWAHGKVLLLATVDPEQQFPECSGCRANDNMALTDISFTDVPALKFTPLSLDWTEGSTTIMPRDPTAAITRTWPYWPLPTNGLEATGAPVHVDLTAILANVAKLLAAQPAYAGRRSLGYNTASLVGCLSWEATTKLNEGCVNLVEGKIFAAEKAALGGETPKYPAVGIYNDSGFTYGVLGAANNIPGKFSYVPDSSARSEVVVHEMLHQLGFRHSGCTSASDEEPWPANSQGQASLVGFGEDRSLTTVGGIGPILTTSGLGRGQGTHDIMSYCFPDWPSTFNWDRVLKRLVNGEEPKPFGQYPAYSSLTATTASTGRTSRAGMVTISAIELHGTPVITEVLPGSSAEVGNVATPFTALARNARGHVTARVPIRAHEDHADAVGPRSEPIDQVTMQVTLPAASAASIQIVKGSKVLSTARAPRGKLRLTVSAPTRALCRRKGSLKLPYRVRPGGALYSSVRVKALVAGHFKTIEIGAGTKSITLLAGTRPKGSSKLKVEYDDGFRSVVRTVKLPKGCRAG